MGRAVLELNIEKSDPSASFAPASALPTSRAAASAASSGAQPQLLFTDPQVGGSIRTTRVLLTLDGYSAPLSAGAFLKNVMDGLYDNRWGAKREQGSGLDVGGWVTSAGECVGSTDRMEAYRLFGCEACYMGMGSYDVAWHASRRDGSRALSASWRWRSRASSGVARG